jgi:translation initiation factor IF-2
MSESKLEIVLKCDVSGTEEAVRESLTAMEVPGVDVRIIQSGVGQVSKSDVLMAETGSRLVVGFNVDVMPRMEQHIKEHGVEIRLYDTIYHLTEDLRRICEQMVAKPPEETVIGQAEVIATFKSKQKSQIIGCEIREGVIQVGKHFRIITAMGPAYFGKIGSLQIENNSVKSGKAGQQVGIGLEDWNKASVGDLVECYEIVAPARGPWKPKSGIYRKYS